MFSQLLSPMRLTCSFLFEIITFVFGGRISYRPKLAPWFLAYPRMTLKWTFLPLFTKHWMTDSHFLVLFSNVSRITTNVLFQSRDPNGMPESLVWDLLDLDTALDLPELFKFWR